MGTAPSRRVNQYAMLLHDEAIGCHPDADVAVYRRAFAVACTVGSASKARVFWAKLPAADQDEVAPLCATQGITVTRSTGSLP